MELIDIKLLRQCLVGKETLVKQILFNIKLGSEIPALINFLFSLRLLNFIYPIFKKSHTK